MSAREEVLGRIRVALADRPAPPPAARGLPPAGALDREAVVELFVERVREYKATVVVTNDPRTAVAAVFAGEGARTVGVPVDLDVSLRPEGLTLVRTTRSRPDRLDALDGALTTCAAGCAEPARSPLTAAPGRAGGR